MRTVILDFGNVVAFFDHRRTAERLSAFSDLPTDELKRRLYGSNLEDRYERGELSTEDYVRRAKESGRLRCPDELFLRAFVEIFWPNPEVSELVPRLKPRHRLLLASNTNDAHYRHFSAQFADVLRHFDHICTSHFGGCRKPEPEFFAYCQRFAAAEPEECVFVDDLPMNVEAARRHGWCGVVYRPVQGLTEQLREAGVQIG